MSSTIALDRRYDRDIVLQPVYGLSHRGIMTTSLVATPKVKSPLAQAIQKTAFNAKNNKTREQPAKRLEQLLETAEEEQYRRNTSNPLQHTDKRHLSRHRRTTLPKSPLENIPLQITEKPKEIRLYQQQQKQQKQNKLSLNKIGQRFQLPNTIKASSIDRQQEDNEEVNEIMSNLEETVEPAWNFKVGDLVEVIKVKAPILMLVTSKDINNSQYQGAVTADYLVDFRPTDVIFHIPNFLKSSEFKELFSKGLLKSGSGEPVDMKQLIHNTEEQPGLLPQVARRILSTFDRTSLSRQWSSILRIQQMYTELHEQEKRENASLDEIAQRVFNTDGSTTQITHAERYAVHRFLYPAHENHSMGQFRFRPCGELQRIEAALRMIRDKEPAFTEFLRRATKMIDLKRSGMLADSDSTGPEQLYCDTDISFLELVRAFIHAEVNNTLPAAFLVDMGVWPEWENVVTLRESIPLDGHHQSPHLEKSTTIPSLPSPASLDSLGSNDFYTKDIVGSLRHDFGYLPVYTIDDMGAKELDDGVSIERTADGHCWLHVHIADPTAYIPPQHLISRRAESQGSTVYFPERHYPMLPDNLSVNRFSLGVSKNAGHLQNVLTFSARLNSTTAQIEDFKVRAGIIRNVHVLQYDSVDKLLDWSNIQRMKNKVIRRRMQRVWHIDGRRNLTVSDIHQRSKDNNSGSGSSSISPKAEQDLRDLQQWANKHMAYRVERGMLMFSLPASNMSTNPFPLPITQHSLQPLRYKQPELANMPPPSLTLQLERASYSPARLMVAELMVMAGRVCGHWCHERHLPVHYRVQKAPVGVPNYLSEALADASKQSHGFVDFILFQKIRAYMSPATQQMIPGQHWTMGIGEHDCGYVKCTSPLRRYTDMLVHWQIKSQLLRDADPRTAYRTAFDMTHLELLGQRMLAKERTIRSIQNNANRFWMIEFLQRMELGPVKSYNSSLSSSLITGAPDWSTMGARHWPAIVLNVSESGSTYAALLLDLGIVARLVPGKGKLINSNLKVGDRLFCRISKTSRDTSVYGRQKPMAVLAKMVMIWHH
ncbi:hypothetical protein BDF19DRAFT_462691 [Syncephalis fuscata]|nr:hypothetical protein BDF19DRAFT_462691 [Syncephalis fuscata]